MKGFKGFDKNLKCRDEQYVVGETKTFSGTPVLCSKGLHFCEHPLDTWTYYKPNDKSRYAQVEAEGVLYEKNGDSKRVGTSLTVKEEIKIPALIKAAIRFVFEKVTPSTGDSAHSATTGDSAHSATTGDSAHSTTTGILCALSHDRRLCALNHDRRLCALSHDRRLCALSHDRILCALSHDRQYSAHSATTGNSAHSATTGNYAHSTTTGDSAHSATTGNYAHSATTGDSAHSATTGYSAHSATTGNSAHSAVEGKNAIAISLGRNGKAKAKKGGWIVLVEYKNNGDIKAVETAQVLGEKMKEDTFYTLKDGKFVEAED